jgi:hypothetical protein
VEKPERALVEGANDRVIDEQVAPRDLETKLDDGGPAGGISVLWMFFCGGLPIAPSGYTESNTSPITWNADARLGPPLPT